MQLAAIIRRLGDNPVEDGYRRCDKDRLGLGCG